MLKSTFCCFSGISESGERRLWEQGVETWAHVKFRKKIFSDYKWNMLSQEIAIAKQALECGLADFFLNRLRGLSKARILPDFREKLAFLDIETDGIRQTVHITTIALYHRKKLQVFVRGRNLYDFIKVSAQCNIWVTYNGSRFDLPILRREFGLDFAQPHLDMMPILRRMGGKGGLKACEKALGYERQAGTGMTGLDAVKLWRQYNHGGEKTALMKLASYNGEDVLSLEWLLTRAYNETMSGFPVNYRVKLLNRTDRKSLLDSVVL